MTRKEIFATIKEANAIVDKMNRFPVDSTEYEDLSEQLYFTLDPLMYPKYVNHYSNFSLHTSKNGKYYVKFAD